MLYAFPLTLIPFILFNIIGFMSGGAGPWSNEILAIPMVGGLWIMTWGDLMLVLGLVMLFLETLKAARPAQRAISNHLASTGAFILYLIEFILLGVAANSTFFILMLMSLFDVVAGFTISIRTASRDVTYNRSTDPV
jgi:hypothetical protein